MVHQRIAVKCNDELIQLVIIKLISVDSVAGDKLNTLVYLAYNHGMLYELIVKTKQLSLVERVIAVHLDASLVVACGLKAIVKGIISEALDSELSKRAKFELQCDYYSDFT